MIKEFPYIKEWGKFYPFIPLIIANKISAYALIDSGAEVCLFRQEVAEQLGIKIEKGEKSTLTGIGGKITIYKHIVPIHVTSWKFNCKIAFSKEFEASINILGRNNFFQHFIIKFDELKRKTFLEART